MVAVPAETPVTIPVEAFTVAMTGVFELQVPPVVVDVKADVSPTQIF